MPLLPSARLGPYEILGSLGAGGMGEVYKARDTRLDRVVAVKVLPPQVAAREDLRQRFEREARTVSALNHPHICTLFDVGSADGVHFFVLEYIDGESLEKRLERGPLPLEEAQRVAVQVAGALDQAHRAGVIHRDLKPGNIMLTKSGAKLLDFGLAKVRDANAAVAAATVLTSLPTQTRALTTEGTIMGTFQYMAPEQLEGGEADARSDIFSFGAVLYEMVTGRKAFQGKSHASLIGAILTAEPAPVSTLQPLAPPALDRVIRRCLAKDPDDRWQSARDLANELQWIAESGSQAGVPALLSVRRRGRERLAWTAAAALGLLLATTLFFTTRHFTERQPAQAQVRFFIEKPEGSDFYPLTFPALSPDGQRIAFASVSGNVSRIYVRPLNSFTAQAVPGTEGSGGPFFSPDGRALASFGSGVMKRVDLAGGGAQTICPARGGPSSPGAWGRDGTILFPGADGVYAVPAAGGAPRQVTTVDEKAGERSHVMPGFLPDSRHFLYTSTESTNTRYSVWIGSLDDPKLKKHVLDASGIAQFAPPSWLLFIRDESLFAQRFDPGKLELQGEPVPLAESVAGISGLLGAAYSASSDGTLVWRSGTSGRVSQLTWFDRSGRSLGTFGPSAEIANPVLSPDGKRVLITIRDPGTKTRDIWVYDLARDTASKVTFDPAEDFNPAWSPDGQYFAFSSSRKGHKDIYRKRADGTGAEEELLVSNLDKNVESWSPDGKYIVYNQADGGAPQDIYLLPLDGDRKPVPFATSRFFETEASMSPNGRWIAYSSNESGPRQIYVQPVPGPGTGQGKWQVSTTYGTAPQWRKDGRELHYLNRAKLMAVPVKTDGASFEAGTPMELFNVRLGPSLRNHFTAAADGQRFLVASPPEAKGTDRFSVLLNFTAGLKR